DMAPDKQVTHADLLAWVKARAEDGCRVIGVDPVTALAVDDKPWIADSKFMAEAKAIVRRHGCSLLLVTHPRVGGKGKSVNPLDALAGGAAFVRFAQTVLWFYCHDTGRQCCWHAEVGGVSSGRVNRSVRIAKARNAAGGGRDVAFHFDGA